MTPMHDERDPDRVRRGDLLFLVHPTAETLFSGYGLVVQTGSRARLYGLLLVDRPRPVAPAWLASLKARFGDYQLYRMTHAGERGIACQMWIAAESQVYVRRLNVPFARQMQEALLPLLVYPPAPKLTLAWHAPTQLWSSAFYEGAEADPIGDLVGKRRKPLFPLGTVVVTPGARAALTEAGQLPQAFLHRHVTGDWGTLPPPDIEANELALRYGGRLLSSYTTCAGVKLWVITEADRSATTLLLPSEY